MYGVGSKSIHALLFFTPVILITTRQSLDTKQRDRRQVNALQHNFHKTGPEQVQDEYKYERVLDSYIRLDCCFVVPDTLHGLLGTG